MEYPEINKNQLEMIELIIKENMIAFTLVSPDEALDSPQNFTAWTQSNNDADGLVALGLFENASEDNKEYLQHIKLSTKRDFRIFKLTPMAEKMFAVTQSTGKPN